MGEKQYFLKLKEAFYEVFEYLSEDFADDYLEFFFAENDDFDKIDFSKLISLHDDIIPAKTIEAKLLNSQTIALQWDFDANASPNDFANVVIYNTENKKLVFKTRCGTRDTENINIVLNYRVKEASNLHAWIFFNVFNTKIFSNWTYFNIK